MECEKKRIPELTDSSATADRPRIDRQLSEGGSSPTWQAAKADRRRIPGLADRPLVSSQKTQTDRRLIVSLSEAAVAPMEKRTVANPSEAEDISARAAYRRGSASRGRRGRRRRPRPYRRKGVSSSSRGGGPAAEIPRRRRAVPRRRRGGRRSAAAAAALGGGASRRRRLSAAAPLDGGATRQHRRSATAPLGGGATASLAASRGGATASSAARPPAPLGRNKPSADPGAAAPRRGGLRAVPGRPRSNSGGGAGDWVLCRAETFRSSALVRRRRRAAG